MTKIAVYGTLRRGYGLNRYLDEGTLANYVGTETIKGFRMYSFGADYYSYPIVSRVDNEEDEIEVELYDVVDDAAFRSIDAIELGAGYHHGEIEVDGERYLIYLQDEEHCQSRLSRIESGDFNEFASRFR